METSFMVLSLNVRRESSKEIWLLRGFFTVSLILVNLHPATAVKYSPFFGVNNLKSVSRIGGKMMEVNHTMYLSKMSAIIQANMRSPSGNCNATKTIQKNKW